MYACATWLVVQPNERPRGPVRRPAALVEPAWALGGTRQLVEVLPMTATARCDLTDLLVNQCAHCLGHDKPEKVDPKSLMGPSFRVITAQYEGRCVLDARHAIEPGDSIANTDHGWICGACTSAALPF